MSNDVRECRTNVSSSSFACEQEAECEAAESQLLLEHAVADVHAEDEREFVVFD